MSTIFAASEAPAPPVKHAPLEAVSWVFGAAILLGSCLLFLVEPLISKLILPWFGGSAAVWTIGLLFFQAALLAGYLYAHLLARGVPARWQPVIHAALLLASVAALPILPNSVWQPKPGQDPTWRVFGVLAASVGLPYLLLSSTGPLLQSWYAARRRSSLPYRYFALSNAGSLAALGLYPIAVEPFLRGRNQAWLWSAAYFVFVLLSLRAARLAAGSPAVRETVAGVGGSAIPTEPKLSRTRVVLWVALACCASTLLLTVTNLLTRNIAPIPLLWVVPLGIYLASFILCFENDFWYRRWLFVPALPFALWWLASHTHTIETSDVATVVPLICAAFFVCSMICHGEVARLKPMARRSLTAFYLSLALGAVVGGVFVALIAPRFFNAVYEYPMSYLACGYLVLYIFDNEKDRRWKGRYTRQLGDSLWLVGLTCAVVLSLYAIRGIAKDLKGAVALGRNFYGALRVDDFRDEGRTVRELWHGTIAHGTQILDAPFRSEPTSYYGRDSGAGLAWQFFARRGPVNAGVVGLGVGTMAAYAKQNDHIRFYELDPLVVDFAHRYFTFVSDCAAHVHIVPGDARLSMRREPSRQFDVLILDAFQGDAIPTHLLTKQAFDIYWRHLKPDGALVVHISNQYLDLAPVVALDARARGLAAWEVDSDADDVRSVFAASYVVASGRRDFFEDPLFNGRLRPIHVPLALKPWSDDFTSLWPILQVGVLARR